MTRWRVRPARTPLRGALRAPGDKSISHRALILAAIANGESTLRGLGPGDDVARTLAAVRALGIEVVEGEGGALRVRGAGLQGLRAPAAEIDCGGSGTTMRLLAGLLAGQEFEARLSGNASLSRRPMARVTRPLRARGARVDGVFDASRNEETSPLDFRGVPRGARLSELEYAMPVASAQVKSALLISGLGAAGATALTEPVVSRDHTERMLEAMGAPVQTMGPAVYLDPEGWSGELAPLDLSVPGDVSSAIFLVTAAHLLPGSRIVVRGVGTNPTRIAAFDVLRDMGGGVHIEHHGARGGEPVGDVHVGAFGAVELRGPARVGGELAVRAIDEVPALVAAAALSPRGVSEFRDLQELRVKESDRIEALFTMLRAFGVGAEVLSDGLRVQGGATVQGGARIDSHGDHRIAMAAAVLALRANGDTVIDGAECAEKSYPGFAAALAGLGAQIEVEAGA